MPDSIPIHSALVVDDSPLQRTHAVEILRQLGVTDIREASDGLDALRLLDTLDQIPELFIVDLEMPNMDGIEFMQQIAARRITPALVVASSREIALISSVRTMLDVMELPVLGAIQKPLTSELLADAIRRYKPPGPLTSTKPQSVPSKVTVEELRRAVDAGYVLPYFQPKLDLQTGRLIGLESLARWIDPDRGLIPPDAFISVAEESGYIHELTLHLIERALRQLQEWNTRGFKPHLSINLSPLQLSWPDLARELLTFVQDFEIQPEQIVWEVTESAATDDLGAALGTLARLRLKGFGLSIDDYGTGFSSLQQLSRIPFSELKIDKSFIHGVHGREELKVILRSALDMARQLKLVTVAEGIETEEDLRLLQAYGCQIGQGYLFARPMAAEKLPQWVAEQAPTVRALVCAQAA